MKKLITTLLLTLTVTLTALSQSMYYRAQLFTLGERLDNGKINWNTNLETDILLEFNDNNVKIYSETLQHYHIVGLLVEDEDENTNVWSCKDSNGINCRLYLTVRPESDAIALTIEYSDYAWMYLCTKE